MTLAKLVIYRNMNKEWVVSYKKSQPRLIDTAFHIQAKIDMVSPNTQIIICETKMSCLGVALGLMYAL